MSESARCPELMTKPLRFTCHQMLALADSSNSSGARNQETLPTPCHSNWTTRLFCCRLTAQCVGKRPCKQGESKTIHKKFCTFVPCRSEQLASVAGHGLQRDCICFLQRRGRRWPALTAAGARGGGVQKLGCTAINQDSSRLTFLRPLTARPGTNVQQVWLDQFLAARV